MKRINGSHHIFFKEGIVEIISVPVHGGKDLQQGMQKHLGRVDTKFQNGWRRVCEESNFFHVELQKSSKAKIQGKVGKSMDDPGI